MSTILLSLFLSIMPVDLTQRLPVSQDYGRAEQIAKVFHKPMIVLFTGSDWNPESQALVDKILYDPAFYDVLRKEFVFAQVDFPEIERHHPDVIVRNNLLKEAHHVESFPTLVLIDEEQHEISRTGLVSTDPEQFAAHLKSLRGRYVRISEGLEMPHIDNENLKFYYTDARELGAPHLLQKVLERGLAIKDDPYFHIERYNELCTAGNSDTEEAKNLRETALKMDPNNVYGAHYRLAILDFQATADDTTLTPEDAVAPLKNYIAKYGASDRDHLWRLHFMLAHYLFSRDCHDDALEHARTCYQEAPSFMKKEAFRTVECMREQIKDKK